MARAARRRRRRRRRRRKRKRPTTRRTTRKPRRRYQRSPLPVRCLWGGNHVRESGQVELPLRPLYPCLGTRPGPILGHG
eukprot:8024016-Pyramimonas_sp.AAC.1